jgi:hypothetical protein
MHRIIVEEKKWIGENRFLQALNYCTCCPGRKRNSSPSISLADAQDQGAARGRHARLCCPACSASWR